MVGLFTITDSIYGSTFYALTGLHGFHVFVGVIFLVSFVLFSLNQYQKIVPFPTTHSTSFTTRFTSYRFQWWSHRVAFDGAVWYWHFVDVVWIFVLYTVYMWPFDSGVELVAYGLHHGIPTPSVDY